MKRVALFLMIVFLLLMGAPALAAVTPIDFTGFTGAGFAPTPTSGQLDSDLWRVTGLSDNSSPNFGDTLTSGDFARGSSTGSVTTGGIYAFDVGGGNIILGVQPTGNDFTPGDITLKLQNTTGNTISNLYVAYKVWYYNDQDRSSSLDFYYSLDDVSYTGPIFAFTTPQASDVSPVWQSQSFATTLNDVNLASGAFIYLQWKSDDVAGSGSRDEFGIDDIEVRIGGPTAIDLVEFNGQPASSPFSPLLLGLVVLTGGVLVFGRRAYRHR